jgi:preprotein translocase subunit SecB
MPEQQQPPKYPVQPTFIAVREIHFVAHRPPSPADRIEQSKIKISQSVSPFDEERKLIQVTLKAEFGFDKEAAVLKPPFSLKIEMTGEFSIEDSFPRDKIQLWASVNAGFIIFPYLRERLYYITSQGGFPPILLPLIQIPTIKIEKPQTEPVLANH